MDITKLSLIELKALHYDLTQEKNVIEQNIAVLNQQIKVVLEKQKEEAQDKK